jgi:putative Ig domain-containing protein
MRFRFLKLFVLLALAAGAFAGVARALDFDDEDPDPPRAEIGLVYEYEIGTHAGCLPHHLQIDSGQLPPGLTLRQLNDHTGIVEGIATQEGTWSVWMSVKDCENKSAEAQFTFTVWGRRFSIATDSLPAAGVGAAYSFALQTAGIPSNTTWEVTKGSLPAGLGLTKEGVISGTPTAGGSSTFEVTATGNAKDFTGTRIDSRELTLTVKGSLSAALTRPVAEVGVPARAALAATGGTAPYTWSAIGALPSGLHIAASGAITGVPKRAGSYTINAHVVDASGTAKDVQARLVVRPRLAIAATSLTATAGRAYRKAIGVRGGVGPLRWSGALPSGLRLDAASGTITGTPARAGVFHVRLRVRDALGATSTKTFILTVR